MLSCIIIDDEDLAIEVLRNYTGLVPGLRLDQTFTNAVSAFDYLQTHKTDIIFLDINMPVLNGLSFLQTLQNPPAVILTTAHSEFALESYQYAVIDYLLKPFSFDRFLKALAKLTQLRKISLDLSELSSPAVAIEKEAPFLFIKSDRQFIKILVDDILWIESIRNHIKIKTATKIYITQMTISDIETKLPPQRFMRLHRSFIAALPRIEKFNAAEVEIGGQILPIGSAYKNAVLARLLKHTL